MRLLGFATFGGFSGHWEPAPWIGAEWHISEPRPAGFVFHRDRPECPASVGKQTTVRNSKNTIKFRLYKVKAVGIATAAILVAAGGWLAFENIAQAQTDLPAPSNTRAINGDDSGDVVVSWDSVSGASGYSVRWVNLGAAWTAYRAGLDWQKLIQSVDVSDSGTAGQALTINNLTPGTQYSFAVGGKSHSAADPIWSSWVGLTPQGEDGTDVQDVVQLQSAALAIAQNANALVGVGSTPTNAGMTRVSIGKDMAAVGRLKGTLNAQLAILKAKGPEDRVAYIEAQLG